MNFGTFISWNIKLYKAFGIVVRIHWILIIYLVLQVIRAILANGTAALWFSPVIALLIFAVILLHEYGHCIAARHVGGSADTIVLWPLGGLAMCSCPGTPKAEFLTSFGGPLVNIILLVTGYLMLWFNLIPAMGSNLLIYYLFVVMLEINKNLLLFNLIPCYPLDGGRMFKAILWPIVGYQRAVTYTIWLALIISAIFFVHSIIISDFVMVIISLLVFFHALQIKRSRSLEAGSMFIDGSLPGSAGYGPGAVKPSFLDSWREQREQKKIQKRQKHEAQRMFHLDMILDKINRVGIKDLSEEELLFLNETSDYLKNKDR